VRAFFDISVLAAASYEDNEKHDLSKSAILASAAARGTAAHCLAEMYATLTVLPAALRFSPGEVTTLIDAMPPEWSFVTLTAQEYLEGIHGLAALRLTSGAIYDALIARCAIKFDADRLYTWNPKHFTRLGGRVAHITREPR
jgi:predicted nucleic acid-binding protein